MKNGLIPNLFDESGDGGADHYNTVDASLWFVHAVRELWKATSRADTELLKASREIIAAYRWGTDFNIRMDPRDSLIAAGDHSTQLTWMDAKRDGIAFTPRNGKPVEINAMWFNTLRCLAEMTEDASERDELIALSDNVSKSFREQFWWEERRCLHDVLSSSGGGSDATRHDETLAGDRRLRPNQIFAVSLAFSPLTKDQQRAVVKLVGERLLTPFGLRTLDRDDPQYRGRYEGNLFDRDSAYHQGTVWPWLIGPYCEALLRVNDFSDDAKRQIKQIIQPLIDEMSNASGGRCLNQIAEVYDGDPPHRPSGCPAQAWSVAEVLRIATLLAESETTDEHG
jgi:predicted glycogen debranching enzyme